MKTPHGFKLAGTAAGIKKEGLDLGLITSETAAIGAAIFTKNAFPAAPVLVSRENLRRTNYRVRAILTNSGNANAANGEAGLAATRRSGTCVAELIGCPAEEVFVASTGVIGRPLPVDKICSAIPALIGEISATGERRLRARL